MLERTSPAHRTSFSESPTRGKPLRYLAMRARWLVILAAAAACGARTELGVVSTDAALDSHTGVEAGLDAGADASVADALDALGPDAPSVCDFGTEVADPFGAVVFWNGGAPLPAGHYRITYVDGCLKYSPNQGWTVNAYANGPDTLYLVGDNASPVAPAPGTVGFLDGQGGFASFDACVAANVSQDAPLEFDFAGGALGLKLADDPYGDNIAGENGRSPTYRLSSCP